MNVGDKLTAINLYGNEGYVSGSGSFFTTYLNTIGTSYANINGYFRASHYAEYGGSVLTIDKYLSGSWVNFWTVSSYGDGDVYQNFFLSPGYWRIAHSLGGTAGYTVYRSRNAGRFQNRKIRVIYSDFSGYAAAGNGKLYASDANVGQLCTYD